MNSYMRDLLEFNGIICIIGILMLGMPACKTSWSDRISDLIEGDKDKQEKLWTNGPTEKIDFGGQHEAGYFSLELRGSDPGRMDGEPERFIVEFFGDGLKQGQYYSRHKGVGDPGANGMRHRWRDEDGTFHHRVGGYIYHPIPAEPHTWEWRWDDGKMWCYMNQKLCKGYPIKIPGVKIAGCYVGGKDHRKAGREWRNPTFEEK